MEAEDELKIIKSMWASEDRYLARLKSKLETIKAFKIANRTEAHAFIEFLYELADTTLRIELICADENESWIDVLKRYDKKSTQFCGDFEIHVFGKYTKETLNSLSDKLVLCDKLLGRRAVNACIYNIKCEKEARQPRIRYMSGDEEARECNRQFRSMMDDNDAWGNID